MTIPGLSAMGVTELASAVDRREVTSVEIVTGLLGRIERREPAIRAWETVDAEGAIAAAQSLDEELASGRRRGPLHGVPVGAKDIFYTAGLVTRAGSPIHKDFVPSRDATSIARLRQAGAIVLGKTATTQFAMGDAPETRNPWNLEHTPGGSSSGSAAAVAARMVPATLGSQTAGSVLRPSAYCGVVGLKPTYGRIGRGGVFPLGWSLDHVGVLVRSVADAALMLSVLAGPHPGDRSAAWVPVPDYARVGSVTRPPRIGLVRSWFQDRTSAEGWEAVEEGAHRFAGSGAFVEVVEPPKEFELAADAQRIIMAVEASSYHAQNFASTPEAYRPRLRALIELGQLVPTAVYHHAQRVRSQLGRRMLPLFDGYDVLMMSSATGAAPVGLESTGDPICNAPWSLFGFPSITIPAKLTETGLPLGIQLVARPWQEATLLRSARWCEAVLDFQDTPPEDLQ